MENYKQWWFVLGAGTIGALIGAFIVLSIASNPEPAEKGLNEGQVQELKAEISRLEAELDPIRRAEEASAAIEVEKATAAAKAEADAKAEAEAAKEQAEAEAQAAASKAAAEEAANTFTDGTYLVGADIQPGTYRGTVNGEVAYWARLRDTAGGMNSIIANSIPSGPFVLTIQSGDNAVELRGVKLVKM